MLLQSTTITFATFIPRPAVSAIASSLLHPPICLMTSLAGLSLHLQLGGDVSGGPDDLTCRGGGEIGLLEVCVIGIKG